MNCLDSLWDTIHSLPFFQVALRAIFLEQSKNTICKPHFPNDYFSIFYQIFTSFYYVVKAILRRIGSTVKEIYALSRRKHETLDENDSSWKYIAVNVISMRTAPCNIRSAYPKVAKIGLKITNVCIYDSNKFNRRTIVIYYAIAFHLQTDEEESVL